MRNKKHSEVYVDIYVDGRVYVITANRPKGIRESTKIHLIEEFVTKAKKHHGDKMEAGRYKVTITRFRMFPKPDLQFDLEPVQ